MDLPFARPLQTAEGVTHESLSAHKDEGFGGDYGVLIKEWRLLQRAVFVIDRANRITYADYSPTRCANPTTTRPSRRCGRRPERNILIAPEQADSYLRRDQPVSPGAGIQDTSVNRRDRYGSFAEDTQRFVR